MWKNVLFVFGFVLMSNCAGRLLRGRRNHRLSLSSLTLILSHYLSLSFGAMISQPEQNLALIINLGKLAQKLQ